MMNRRGQVMIFLLMFGVVVIILALSFAKPLNQFTEIARNQTNGDQIGLDCDNTSISDFDQGTCVIIDTYTPYFIGFLIAFAGAVIIGRLVLGGGG